MVIDTKNITAANYSNADLQAIYLGGVEVWRKAANIDPQLTFTMYGDYDNFDGWGLSARYSGESTLTPVDGVVTTDIINGCPQLQINFDRPFDYISLNKTLKYKQCEMRFKNIDLSGWSVWSDLCRGGQIGALYLESSCQMPERISMSGAFMNANTLQSFKIDDYSGFIKITDWSYTFGNCEMLANIIFWGGVDFSEDNSYPNPMTFYNCTSLTQIIWNDAKGLTKAVDLSSCPLINESAMRFIDAAETVSDTPILTFSQSTFNTLTEEQIATATAKGWTIAVA